jgi:hypothetical protein
LKNTLSYITFHLLSLVKVKGRNVFYSHFALLAIGGAGDSEFTLLTLLHTENPNCIISWAWYEMIKMSANSVATTFNS